MATTILARSAANLQACKATFSGKVRSVRPAQINRRLVCRAEERGLAKRDAGFQPAVPGFTQESTLEYLDGTLPADYGFDPLGLLDPVNSGGLITPQWLAYSEVFHGRWAMLGAAGCIAPEILGKIGAVPSATGIPWFKAGVIPPVGSYDGYWADPYVIFFVEIILMQFAELKRLQDFRKPGSQGKQYFLGLEAVLGGSGDPAYPGGPWFNLFNLGKTEESMKDFKAKELKNGRLAMVAVFGYGAQAIMTGVGPFQNLLDHVSDPFNNNILTNLGKLYGGQ